MVYDSNSNYESVSCRCAIEKLWSSNFLDDSSAELLNGKDIGSSESSRHEGAY